MASFVLYVFFFAIVYTSGVAQECQDSTLRFTLQPEDKQVCFGGSVTFDCEYQGTRERPSWCINSTIYPPVNLPPNHTYDGAVLTVHYAGTNLNNNTYQCFFPTLDSKSEFCHVSSHTSVLSVLSPDTCICQREDQRFCSCLEDHVEANLSPGDRGVSVSCDTNLSNTNVFEIEVESVRVNKSYKKNMACRGNDSMVQFPYTDICAMDLEYALYATLNSTDVVAANVHSKCRLYLKNITEDVSSECSEYSKKNDTKKWEIIGAILGVVILIFFIILTANIIAFANIRRRKRWNIVQWLKKIQDK